MIPRLAQTDGASEPYAAFLAALKRSGFTGDISPADADRTVFATDNSIYRVTPQAVLFPRDTADVTRVMRLLAEERFRKVVLAPRPGRRDGHERAVADLRHRAGPVAPYEPHPGDRPSGATRARAGRGREGPAQCGPRAAWPVLRAGAVHIKSRDHRGHDLDRRLRPGVLPLWQDPRPRAGACHGRDRRDGLAVGATGE